MGVLPLESVIGFDGKVTGGLVLHPDGRTLIYPLGATVVVKELGDTFAQTFLQGRGLAQARVGARRLGEQRRMAPPSGSLTRHKSRSRGLAKGANQDPSPP